MLRNGIAHREARRFDLEAVRRDGGSLGLVSIEERGHAIRGDGQIGSAPRRGTAIRVRMPRTVR